MSTEFFGFESVGPEVNAADRHVFICSNLGSTASVMGLADSAVYVSTMFRKLLC